MNLMKPFFKRGAPLGQHLLTNPRVAEVIAKEAGAEKSGATILEVGPGKGALTKELLKLGAKVIAVEKDSAMIATLREVFPREIASGQLNLIEGDARDVLNAEHSILNTPYSVAANIPYYITGELIRLFLTAEHQPSSVVLLVQKEVADRIARSRKESLLSLSVKAYGTPRYVQTVTAGNFNPPPKVDSAVLSITNISRQNFADASEERFFDLLHAGFGQKRKTLLGNLRRALKETSAEDWQGIFTSLNLDARVRAEDVSLSTWLDLARHLK